MENTEIPPCEIRPYDHLWDMYYDEFEDENLENEPSLEKINVEFTGEQFDFVLKYMEQVGATTVQNAILNAISIAFDRAE